VITPQQLFRHGFIATPTTDITGFFMRGKINGVLSGGVFHFPTAGEWHQCKNIGHLKFLYRKHVGEKLEYNANFDIIEKLK
jgi:hypothetical protein